MDHRYSTVALVLFIGIALLGVFSEAVENGIWTRNNATGLVYLSNLSDNVCIGANCAVGYELSVEHNATVGGSPVCTAANGYCSGSPNGNGTLVLLYDQLGTSGTLTLEYQ